MRVARDVLVQKHLADFFSLRDGVVEARHTAPACHGALEEAAVAADDEVDAVLGCAVELCLAFSI